MKRIQIITAILLAIVMQTATAEGIQLKKYYRATCDDYTGTWEGVITDPTDLFGDGGPWPVTMRFTAKDGEVIGESTAIEYAGGKGKFARRLIRAHCSNGQLQDIYWGKLSGCGSLSQNGELVSKNMLVLQLNFESAMIGANLYAFLERKNNTRFIAHKDIQPYDPKAVQSCH